MVFKQYEQRNTIQMELNEQYNSSLQNQSLTIPFIEEQLLIDKKVIETGKINISKTIFQSGGLNYSHHFF